MHTVIENKWAKEVGPLIDKYENVAYTSCIAAVLRYEEAIEFVNYLVKNKNVCLIDVELLSVDASDYTEEFLISITRDLYTDDCYPAHEGELEVSVEKLYRGEYKSPLTGITKPAGYLTYEAGVVIIDSHVNEQVLDHNSYVFPLVYKMDQFGELQNFSTLKAIKESVNEEFKDIHDDDSLQDFLTKFADIIELINDWVDYLE